MGALVAFDTLSARRLTLEPSTTPSIVLGTAAEVLCNELGCQLGVDGHTQDFAAERREEEGPNELYKQKPPSFFLLFVIQLTDFVIMLLIGAGA